MAAYTGMVAPPGSTSAMAPDPAMGGARKEPRNWLEYEHPEYEACAPRWRFSWDFYTGSVIFPDRVAAYLVQRVRGESDDAFRERCRMAEYTNHFAAVVDSLTGILAAVEPQAERQWTREGTGLLGEPADDKSVAARLMRDATGDGEGWLTLWKRVAAMLFVLRRAWLMVDAALPGVPVVRTVFPFDVTNWRFDPVTGALIEAVVCELSDGRQSLKDKPAPMEHRLYLTVDGWERYRIDGDGKETLLPGPEGAGKWSYVTRAGAPTVPLVMADLPIGRDVGFSLAKKAQGMFNKESERDHLVRYSNFPILGLDVTTDDAYEKLKSQLTRGANVVQGKGHAWISPDSTAATVGSEVLKRKVEEFYIVGFREYGDAGRERTATEVQQDVAAGLGAILSLAKDALDNAENDVFYFCEQAVSNTAKTAWGAAGVKRPSKFTPVDAADVAKAITKQFLGETAVASVGVAGRAEVARRAATAAGLTIDEAQLTAHARVALLSDILSLNPALKLPPGIAAQATVDLAIAAGYIDGNDEAAMKTALAEAQTAAEAAAEAARRLAEGLPGAGGGEDDDELDDDEKDDAKGKTGEGAEAGEKREGPGAGGQ